MSNVFERYPNLEKYFQTSDGEKFFTESPAYNHAKTLDNKKVETVERKAAEEKPKTAAEIIAMVPDMDFETAEATLDAENSAEKPRKSVVEALEKRIAELENPAE